MEFLDVQAAVSPDSQLSQLSRNSSTDGQLGSLVNFVVEDNSQLTIHDAPLEGTQLSQAVPFTIEPATGGETQEPQGTQQKSPDYSKFYLITWPRPAAGNDDLRIPGEQVSKEGFAQELERAYKHFDIPLNYLCVGAEYHSDRTSIHFHACTAASRRHRWRRIGRFLRDRGIAVNFRSTRSYLGGYTYCTKSDTHPYLTQSHPAFPCEPTKHEYSAAEEQGTTGETSRIRRLSDLAPWIVSKRIRTERAFLSAANKERNVRDYLLNQNESPASLLSRVWTLHDASHELDRSNVSRVDILRDAAQEGPCSCGGQTAAAITGILQKNGLSERKFSSCILRMLGCGRSRNANLAIYGPSGSGKSFLIKHLGAVFKSLGGLASGSYPLSILLEERIEIFLLDDFRFNNRQVGFSITDCLCFFEGKQPFTIPLPKSSCRCDSIYNEDAPVCITVPSQFDCRDLSHEENNMLNQRFVWLNLSTPISQERRRDLPACGRCFAAFVLTYQS